MAATRSFLEKLNSSHALNPPPQVELKDGGSEGAWAKEEIPAGTRYGPFLGKWTLEPANPAHAWEVRTYAHSRISVRALPMKNEGIIRCSDANYPGDSTPGRPPEIQIRPAGRQIELFHPSMNTFDTVFGGGRVG